MKSRFQCRHCLNKLSAAEGLVGRHMECPMCETVLTVPAPDASRGFAEQNLLEALDRFKLSDWDRAYARKALEMEVADSRTVGEAVVAVRSAARKGRKRSVGEELLRKGAIDRQKDLNIRELVRGATRPKGKLTECANCFETIAADATVCPYCGQEFGDLLVMQMCPNCKREQPSGAKECSGCGADMVTGLKSGGYVTRCPRCGQVALPGQVECLLCGTSLSRSVESIRREEKIERVKQWIALHSLSLMLAGMLIAGLVVWKYWSDIRRVVSSFVVGEDQTALKERLEAFDSALKFADFRTPTDMIDPSLGLQATERTRSCILGGQDLATVVERVDEIGHPEMQLDKGAGAATVYTKVRGRLVAAGTEGVKVESSADLPGVLANLAGGAKSKTALSSEVTWRWVLRKGRWYYAGPLPD